MEETLKISDILKYFLKLRCPFILFAWQINLIEVRKKAWNFKNQLKTLNLCLPNSKQVQQS
jgi:hypothetical protein